MAILSASQIQQYAYAAGFRGQALQIITAIAFAESNGNTNAYNPETAAGTAPGYGSNGLWQIYYAAHPNYPAAIADNPASAASAAYAISNGGTNFTPWSTFNSGAYRQYLPLTSSTAIAPASAPASVNSAPSPSPAPTSTTNQAFNPFQFAWNAATAAIGGGIASLNPITAISNLVTTSLDTATQQLKHGAENAAIFIIALAAIVMGLVLIMYAPAQRAVGDALKVAKTAAEVSA